MKRTLYRLLCAAVLGFASLAAAQDYPTRPIKIVLPFPPGGTLDYLARVAGEKFREKWDQSGVVEHKVGAAGNIGAEFVFKAPPDGYTLLLSPPGPLVVNKFLYSRLGYDSDAFVPITVTVANPNVLIINPKFPADSMEKLIAHAKANPGMVTYASPGAGSTQHLAAEMLQSMGGFKLTHVPYKGPVQALTDVMGGRVDVMFGQFSVVLPNIRAGQVRVIGVGSEKRNAFLADIPAVAEVLPGFVSANWFGLVAPPGTPAALASKLSAAVAESLKAPDVQKRLHDLSLETMANTPAEMAQFTKAESERWGRLIRANGIKAD
jgi:tripartite-type tricarboxylate transporter receptor subunit TctC